MGKIYTASKIAMNYNNIIIISPLRVLAQELLDNVYEYTNKEYNKILLSCDSTLKVKDIKTFIKHKNIISSTFDSVIVLNQFYEKLKNCIVIFDEFHNFSQNNLTNKDDPINILINNNDKKLYLSATPNINIIYDNIYKYSWKDAIDKKYICDFNIILPYTNDYVEELTKMLNIENKFNIKYIAKTYFILKGLLCYGCRNASYI